MSDLEAKGAAARAAALGTVPWRVSIDCWGSALRGDGAAIPSLLSALAPCLAAMDGKVRLKGAEVELRLIIVAPGGLLPGGVADLVGDSPGAPPSPSALPPADSPTTRPRLYFGRAVAPGAIEARRSALAGVGLAARPFAGPTAMDPGVASLMSSAGLVRAGSVAYDPFAGSGSILIAAACDGAHVLGGELDAFALAGRPAAKAAAESRRAAAAATGRASQPRPVPPPTPLPADASRSARRKAVGAAARASAYASGAAGSAAAAEAARRSEWGVAKNFAQYGLPRPAGLLLADASAPPFRAVPGGWLDAILADPPYGVRAGGRKVGGEGGGRDRGDIVSTSSVAGTAPRGPSRAAARFRAGGAAVPTCPYALGDLVWDLLCFAAAALVEGGRLVYFLPSRAGPLDPSSLPTHPALALVAAPAQPLNGFYCRRLVVMSRLGRVAGEAAAEAAHAAGGRNEAAIAAADAVAAGVFGGGEGEGDDGGGGGGGGVARGRGKFV